MINSSLPPYDTIRNQPTEFRHGIGILRTLSEFQHLISIRSSVFISEQKCPYREEFDGNDFCGTHLLAYDHGEPVGSLRIRYFATFVKIERLCLLPAYRNSTIAFRLVRAAHIFCAEKGFTKFYGHAQHGLENFWSRFDAKPLKNRDKFIFSDHLYTEMLSQTPPHPDPITLKKSAYVTIAPEGRWDMTGVLESSAKRGLNNDIALK